MTRVEVVPGRVLRGVGFWLSYSEPHFPDPRLLVDPAWSATERVGVARYLRGGATSKVYRCWPSCEFGCAAADLPEVHRDLTDGVWVWPEDLAHYVEAHAVRPPEVFLEHMRARDYQCPRIEHRTREQVGDCVRFIVDHHDTAFWTAWASERHVCLDLSPPWQSLIGDRSAAELLEARLQRVLDPASPIAPPIPGESSPRAIARHASRDDVLFLAYDQRLARVRVDWEAIGRGATPRPEVELFPTFLEWNAWRREEEGPR